MLILHSPLKSVDRLAFAPDGQYLAAAGGTKKSLVVWKVGTAKPTHVWPAQFDRRYWTFAFDPESGLLLSGDNQGVMARDLTTGTERWRLPTRNAWDYFVSMLAVSADRELLFLLSNHERGTETIQRWRLQGIAPPKRLRGHRPSDDYSTALAFLPTTTSYLVAEEHSLGTRRVAPHRFVEDKQARVRVVSQAGRTLHTWATDERSVWQLAVAPNGRHVAAVFAKRVLIWDAHDFAAPPHTRRAVPKQRFSGAAFSPSSEQLAFSANDGVHLHTVGTWERTQAYAWKIGKLCSVAFSPKGDIMAAGSDQGKVVVWDVES